jgi:hypothetical protein
MSAMGTDETLPAAVAAPRSRRMLAGAIDSATAFAIGRGLKRFGGPRPPAGGDRPDGRAAATLALGVLGPSSDLVRQQLGSPGQRVLGLRTVDRRTGERVARSRTLLLVALGIADQALAARQKPGPDPQLEAEQERFRSEIAAIHERHRDDPAARDAALRRAYEQRPGPVKIDLAHLPVPRLAVVLLAAIARRRLAPTTEVLVRPRPHSP